MYRGALAKNCKYIFGISHKRNLQVVFILILTILLSLRKSDAAGKNIVDTVSGVKAHKMIYDIRLTDELLTTNGYPRPGPKPGTAKISKVAPVAPANKEDRYCRRCGKIFRLDHYDEPAVDQCNYHLKSPGYRRGTFITFVSG